MRQGVSPGNGVNQFLGLPSHADRKNANDGPTKSLRTRTHQILMTVIKNSYFNIGF